MSRQIILDAGPLVAYLHRDDSYHRWALRQFSCLRPPLLTCEAVLTEACFLLRGLHNGNQAVMGILARGVIRVPFRLDDEKVFVAELLSRYADVPMSLADACLVRMSEQHTQSVILTCDSDFQIYRKHGRQTLSVLMP